MLTSRDHCRALILVSSFVSVGCGGHVDGEVQHPSDGGPDAYATADSSANADAPVDSTSPIEAGACTPGATRCAGKGVETCASGGQWASAIPCTQPQPDCSGGACTCVGAVCSGVCTDLQTDDKNCGGCGLACSTGCRAGECFVTLGPGTGPVAINSTDVYWNQYWGGSPPASIMVAPLDGGAPTTLIAAAAAGDIAVDDSNVYWTVFGGGRVMQAPLDGGAPVTIAVTQVNGANAAIAVDATSVYWAAGPLMKAPIGGGSATTLSATCGSCGLAVSGSAAYCVSNETVLSVPVDGGTPTSLATTGGNACIIGVSGGSVYWENPLDGTEMSVPMGGGTPQTLVTGPQLGVNALALDDANLYYALNVDGGVVVKAPLDGGSSATLGALASPGYKAAVGDTSLFVPSNGGVVMITPK